MKKVYLSIFLTMVILTSSIYMLMPDKVKIHVQKTKTDFYVYNDGWTLSATGFVNLFDGTKKMRAKNRSIYNETFGDTTIITREAYYKDNIVTIDKYYFDSKVDDVEQFPIDHETLCINCVGKILHYEYRNIGYDGETRQAFSPEEFDNNMKIEWQDGYYYAKVFQQISSDKLIIRYRPTEDQQTFKVRMFDPVPDDGHEFPANCSANCPLDVGLCDQIVDCDTWNITTHTGATGGSNGTISGPNTVELTSIAGQNNIGSYTIMETDYISFEFNENKKFIVTDVINTINVSSFANDDFYFSQFEINYHKDEFTPTPLYESRIYTFYYNKGVITRPDNLKVKNVILNGSNTSWKGDISYTLGDLINESNVAYSNLRENVTKVKFYLYTWSSHTSTNDRYINNLTFTEIYIGDNLTFYIDNSTLNRSYELNTKAVVNATFNSSETVCIDVQQFKYNQYSFHPDYGINYSCNTSSTQFVFNNSYFRSPFITDRFGIYKYYNMSYNGPENQTFYIYNAGRDDELESVTFNITPYLNNDTNPVNLKVYVNTSLSNTWSGVLKEGSQALRQFNDSTTSKIYNYNTSSVYTDYFRIPKVAVIGNAILNVTGTIREPVVGNEYFLIIIAQSVTCSNFELNGVSCTQLSPGRWKINKSADSYEDNRADVLATVFVGVYPNDGSRLGTSPITTVSSLTSLQTMDETDVGLRGYTMAVDVESVSGDQEVELIGNTTDDESYVSSWSNLAAIQFTGFGTARPKWYIPSANERNSVNEGNNNVWVNSNEMGTDLSADEQTDPLDMKCHALATESASDTARAISISFIMSNSSITFTNITKQADGKTNFLESIDFYVDESVPLLTTLYPTGNWIEVGVIDGTREWVEGDLYNTTETLTNFSSVITSYLTDCDSDVDGFCEVPIITQSGSAGKLTLDTIEINYTTTFNPFTLDLSLIYAYLGNSSGSLPFAAVPITIENDQNGTIEINDFRYDYAGGNYTYIFTAHTPDYTVNRTINLTLYYSDYDIDLPDKISYLEFIPSKPTSVNVSPYGQNNDRGILVVNTTNYGGFMNLSMYLNETHECVNLTVSEDYSKGNGTQLSANDWTNIGTNKIWESNFELWMFADYACNYTEWVMWNPDFYFRGCEVDSICSEDVS